MHAVVGRERAAAVLAVDRRWFRFFVVDFDLLPLRPIINLVVVDGGATIGVVGAGAWPDRRDGNASELCAPASLRASRPTRLRMIARLMRAVPC